MSLPETVVLDVPNLLSVAGIFIALLAAVYAALSARAAQRQANAAEAAVREATKQSAIAREAVSEARSQNRIAIHNERLKTYKALLAFRGKIAAHGINYEKEHLWNFWEYVQISEFYFSAPVAQELKAIVDLALRIQGHRSMWDPETGVTGEERNRWMKETYDLQPELVKRLEAIDPLLKEELRLVEG